MSKKETVFARRTLLTGLISASTLWLAGCPAIFVGGIAAGGVAMIDRRSMGAQMDDKTISVSVNQTIQDAIGKDSHVNVTCYNRQVLLTGEVPDADYKALAETAAMNVQNIKNIVNALAIGPNSSLNSRSSDSYLTARVKTALTDTEGISAGHIKVVSERSAVYLMGIVTAEEANIATRAASTVSGVRQVVRVFEIVTKEELSRIDGQYGKQGSDFDADSDLGQ